MNKRNLGVVALASFAVTSVASANHNGYTTSNYGRSVSSHSMHHESNSGHGIKMNAYVDGYYQYSLSGRSQVLGTGEPVSTTTPNTRLRWNDRTTRTFSFNQAVVGFSHDADPVGFDIRLGFGNEIILLNSYATATNSFGIDQPAGLTTEGGFGVLRRGIVRYEKNKLSLVAGRMDLNFGFEKIDSIDNWNYGRSLTFAAIQPKMMTGLMANYSWDNGLDVSLGVGNSAIRVVDQNRVPTYVVKAAYSRDKATVGLAYNRTNEQITNVTNQANDRWQDTVALSGKYDFSDKTSAALEGTLFRGNRWSDGVSNPHNGQVLSVAGYGKTSFFDDHCEALRLEWLHDNKGYVSYNAKKLSVFSATLTHRYMMAEHLTLTAEARWDRANQRVYLEKATPTSGDSVNRKHQFTLLAAATVSF